MFPLLRATILLAAVSARRTDLSILTAHDRIHDMGWRSRGHTLENAGVTGIKRNVEAEASK